MAQGSEGAEERKAENGQRVDSSCAEMTREDQEEKRIKMKFNLLVTDQREEYRFKIKTNPRPLRQRRKRQSTPIRAFEHLPGSLPFLFR